MPKHASAPATITLRVRPALIACARVTDPGNHFDNRDAPVRSSDDEIRGQWCCCAFS